jgi:hypothetical protein
LFTRIAYSVKHGEYLEARALLDEHDRSFGPEEAWHDLREGYQVLIDCAEYPSEQTRARGRRFVDEQRGSTLRRRVRRACSIASTPAALAISDRSFISPADLTPQP